MRCLGVTAVLLVVGLSSGLAGAEEGRWAEAEGHHFFYWAERVRNGSREERERALRVIHQYARIAKSAAPGLIDELVRPDDEAREEIAEALVAIGKPAVYHLNRSLSDTSAYVRIWCAKVLGRIGPDAAPATEALAAALVPDAHPFERREAARALGAIGPGAASGILALTAAVEVGDPVLTSAAIRSLGQIGEASLEALRRLARHEDDAIATAAAREIRRLVPDVSRDLAALLEQLKTGEEKERYRAVSAIGRMGADAASAVPDLVRVVEEGSVGLSRAAILALGRIGTPTADAALPVLAAKFSDPHRGLHAASAVACFKEAALGVFASALDHPSWRVRERVARYLNEVEAPPERLLPLHLRALGDKSSAVRWYGAIGIAALGEVGPEAKPALREALADPREHIRVAAARALFAVGHRGADIAPALVEGLTSRTIELTEGTAEALISLGAKAVPALGRALRGAKHTAAMDIAAVLHEIGDPAVPALLAGCKAESPGARREAIEALRFLGDDAIVVPELEALLEDEDETVRRAAKRGIEERR